MTTDRGLKAAARELVNLTGDSYQSCLTTVRILRPLSTRLDLGDLMPLLGAEHEGARALALPTEGADLHSVRVTARRAQLSESPSWARPDPQHDDTRLLIPFRLNGYEFFHELFFEGRLRPAGTWQFDTATLPDIVGRVLDSDATDPTAVVRATRPVEEPDLPPGGPERSAYLEPEIHTLAPTSIAPGPGFHWWAYSFEDLGQVLDDDHDDDTCPDSTGCGFTHDWPTADRTMTGIALPEPVVAAYRTLVTQSEIDAAGYGNGAELYMLEQADGSGWFGIETPRLSRLWFHVRPCSAGRRMPRLHEPVRPALHLVEATADGC